jgi:5-methylcytosine-specific restriction endonuclease McrBC GTP-binding regulatory subunit McrB
MSTYDSIVENNYKITKLMLNTKNLDEIKKEFRNYLKQKVERESTISQYLSWMNKIQKWFIEKKIVDNNFIIWYDTDQINEIQLYVNDEIKSGWKAANKPIKNWMSSPWNAWVNFNNNSDISVLEINNEETIISFDIIEFSKDLKKAGLIFSPQLIKRFVASLCTKPFVICSGLSGSGKTKLSQAFAQWISADESQYLIVPVGADWTNREPLLGYPNALKDEEYVSPENGVLDLMIRAKQNIENSEEITKPYFLILDEMNLSHVERYFADFLSTMESGDKIPLHKIENGSLIVPSSIKLPKNLFIIGTVNIDETTYMFSPKVLDRANTIEFRLTDTDLGEFIASDVKLDMDLLKTQGANMSEGFMAIALQETEKNLKTAEADLKLFFSELKKSGAEFGYRTASEIGRLMYMLKELGESGDILLDIAIMQKLLPKLHGSRNKLTKVLPILGGFCLADHSKIKEDYLDMFVGNSLTEEELNTDSNIKYKISFEKICRMYKNAVENGFASYAEA